MKLEKESRPYSDDDVDALRKRINEMQPEEFDELCETNRRQIEQSRVLTEGLTGQSAQLASAIESHGPDVLVNTPDGQRAGKDVAEEVKQLMEQYRIVTANKEILTQLIIDRQRRSLQN